MKLSGWGQYPFVDANMNYPMTDLKLMQILAKAKESHVSLIPRGLGRSYGDSALAKNILLLKSMDHFIHFNDETGLLCCQSGVSLETILEVFVPKGWFLSVTPGTKFVTVGGAIASDVHGKNHHIAGCFSETVQSLKIATANHGIIECSRSTNADLFLATCGGMGLTGVITEATFYLKRVESAYIHQVTHKAAHLEEALDLFKAHQSAHYSVAWIDCLARGSSQGRSLIMTGEHSKQGGLILPEKPRLNIPMMMPAGLLNQYSIQAFNQLYYHKVRKKESKQTVSYDAFFYPLDGMKNWPRLYGKKGFCQYQFVLPKAAGLAGMKEVLERISTSKLGSFLAVLKAFGPKNDNFLSFPMEGHTLALDFKMTKEALELLDTLDEIVLAHDGRVYLTKDARMSKNTFKRSYSALHKFTDVRQRYGALSLFQSLQSKRLGF